MRTRASLVRVLGSSSPVVRRLLSAPRARQTSTRRAPPPRAAPSARSSTACVCDRVGGQALHEDLTGASFRGICHKQADGTFTDTVDQTQLPPLVDGAARPRRASPSPLAQQQADRDYARGRASQTLGRSTAPISSRALDATFPDVKIAVKDVDNPDPTKSCDAPAATGEGRLHDELADMLGRFQDLYNDGTIPQSTESLARVDRRVQGGARRADGVGALRRARRVPAHRPSRLGAVRPIIAYPQPARLRRTRRFALLAADSQPYEPNPQLDANGNRIPVPGPANAAARAAARASAHDELLNATRRPAVPHLTRGADAITGAHAALAPADRPRVSCSPSSTRRTRRSAAARRGTSCSATRAATRSCRSWTASVPAPFVDTNGDGLADVDALGRFVTSNGAPAPSPFLAVGAADALRARHLRPRARRPRRPAPLRLHRHEPHVRGARSMRDLEPLVEPEPGRRSTRR